jgi:hypothetical protein
VWNPALKLTWMSAAMRSVAQPRRRWRGVVRVSTVIAAVSVIGGSVLLGADLVVGAWLQAVAVLAWAVVRFELLGHEKAEGRQIDTEIVALRPISPRGSGSASALDEASYAPTTMKAREGRRGSRVLAVVFLFPFAVTAAIALGNSPTDVAAYALGIVVAVVAITKIVEPMSLSRRDLTWKGLLGKVIVMYLPVAFYVGLLVAVLAGLVSLSVNGEDAFPPPRSVESPESELTTPEEVEEFRERLNSPAPETVPVPSFTVPSFDIPTFAPLVPPAG